MQTFTDAEQEKLRLAFDALVVHVGPAPELGDLVDWPPRARVATQPRTRGWVVLAVVVAGSLLTFGLTALLSSDGTAPVAGSSNSRGDVIVYFANGTPFDALVEVADEVTTWDGVNVASPWTSQEAYEEFIGEFADQPDLIAVIQQDPSILPPSVRVWVEPGTDLSAIAQRAREEFPDASQVSYSGEVQAQLPDIVELPPLEDLIKQVEPIRGYGDYSSYSYASVPWALVTAAEIACMRDQGWPVEPFGDTDTGISWQAIPVEQNQAAQVDFVRCVAGLNLPEYGTP